MADNVADMASAASAVAVLISFIALSSAHRGATGATAGGSVSQLCSSDLDCSLNGDCNTASKTCSCDAPWSGPKCDVLGFARGVAAVPAYGYGTPFATTSWGGNALPDNEGTWHLFVTEIEGARCGLDRWQNQSTVTHATAPNASGPCVGPRTQPPYTHSRPLHTNPLLR